jgi:hypothetical protein
MASVADEDLIVALREILKSADIKTTTPKMIRSKLSEKFGGVDLESKKEFLREQMQIYLDEQDENNQDESQEEDEKDQKPENSHTESKPDGETEDLLKFLAPPPQRRAAKMANLGRSTQKKKSAATIEEGQDKQVEKKKRTSSFSKPLSLREGLREFMGCDEMTRAEVSAVYPLLISRQQSEYGLISRKVVSKRIRWQSDLES